MEPAEAEMDWTPEPEPPSKSGRGVLFAGFALVLGALLIGGAIWGWLNLQEQGAPLVTVDIREPTVLEPRSLPKVGMPGDAPEEAIDAQVSREDAMLINAAVPFSEVPIVPAPAFASRLEDTDRDRARACLAIAAVYEAGSDANDQKPVMQVILNRVRHPAFPNSVCDVVFQGSELATGCQFSFTCDGSMARSKPPQSVLSKAMGLAEWMLLEGVDERVGHATHYHTDWVVPYWSSKLNKLAKINTHIFFSWTGYWGQKAAFREAQASQEGVVALMADYALAHSSDAERIALDAEAWADLNALETGEIATGSTSTGAGAASGAAGASSTMAVPTQRLAFAQGMTPGRWSLDAAGICGELPACRVVGWSDPGRVPGQITPAALAQSPPDLVFVQELRNRIQTAYWDCGQWKQAGTSKCLGSGAERLALVNGGGAY